MRSPSRRPRRNLRRHRGEPRARAKARARWPWRRIGWSCLGVAATLVALAGLARLLDQPIERLTVIGRLRHVTVPEVAQAVRGSLHGAGLVSVNLGQIARAVGALPWVASVSVQRRWPRGLTVRVREQTAVATWSDLAAGTGLLNASGQEFLSPAPPISALPELSGLDGTQQEVTARYLDLQSQLKALGLRIVTLREDQRGAWSFRLADGVGVRLGRSHVRARFARFVSAASQVVKARAGAISYVDMRYGDGFAVGWRTQSR